MTYLDIKYKWLDANDAAAEELTATLARLQIFIGKSNITEHRPPSGSYDLQIPVFYLAEWIAENWWVLLFEPRKHEQDDDPDFIGRHSLIAAQHGFPLPALSIIPFGRSIGLSCVPRRAQFANVQFIVDAFGDAPRDEVQQVLTKFVGDTVARLESRGIADASLVHTWRELQALTDDEKKFCELVGSLGVSPADVSDDLANAVEQIYGVFGERATRDFCLAATATHVIGATKIAEDLNKELEHSTPSELSPLLSARLPKENFYAPSWRRGLQAAKNLRETLNISPKDPSGADKLFEKLRIDTSKEVHVRSANASPPLTGAIDRQDSAAQIILLQDQELQRRFTAGRAAYLGWVSEAQSRRLVTNAVTRDQQASRQFAAEILIPRGYLEGLSGSKRVLRREQIYEAARQRRVMPDVAFWQASNAGIRVSAI